MSQSYRGDGYDQSSYGSSGGYRGRSSGAGSSSYAGSSQYTGSSGYGGFYRTGYPPIHVPPVKPYPPDPFIDQFPLPEALRAGTLFRWLYDPYEKDQEIGGE